MTPREIMRLVESAARDVERRLLSKLQGTVTIAFTKSTDDAAKMQSVNATLADDESGDFEHYQPGGVSHRASAGAEGVALTVGGERAKVVMLSVSKRGVRVRASMAGGTVLYAEVGSGAAVEVKPDGPGGFLVGNDPAQAMVLGDLLKTWLETHVHPTAMGPSGPPATASTLGAVLSSKHKLDV